MPTFAWTGVGGADHYEFQLAADAQFNSPVLGSTGHFTTKNTRATVAKTPPNGRYWWRVRAVSKSGGVSGWSVRPVVKNWAQAPALSEPANGKEIHYPNDPLVLSWQPVAGAAEYSVAVAREPSFTTLVGGRAIETSATSTAPPAALAAGVYYWRVTPLDAEHNQGKSSAARSFNWAWCASAESATKLCPKLNSPSVTDLVEAPEFNDPQLSWDAVPGAARYELDVNFSQDFSPGSRVCCSKSTVATSYSPKQLLDNNTYYWRVRAIDVHGNQGDWVLGQPFTKTFDNVGGSAPNNVTPPAVKGLHVRDNASDPGSSGAGFATSSPVVVWTPVVGASAYELSVVPFTGFCSWAASPSVRWDVTTGNTAWTPLGKGKVSREPYPAHGVSIATDSTALVPGQHYCVRVRAVGDNGSKGRVYGDYAYLEDAFSFSGYPAGQRTNPSISEGNYLAPHATNEGRTPLFTWSAVPGASSYWVLVARDPSFTTLVDYGFTQIPAYAPRKTYADETTAYYWAVLPSTATNPCRTVSTCGGNGGDPVIGSPLDAHAVSFNKRSTPPQLLTPAQGAKVGAGQPTFRWAPSIGARNYHLQVSTDPKFQSGIIDDVTTDSTAFTSDTTYPPGKTLYWRVQANDENKIALTWNPAPDAKPQSFERRLPAPSLHAKASSGDQIPAWRWSPLAGAVSYDLHVVLPDGSTKDFSQIPSPAWVAGDMRGLGVFRWSIRGEFPTSGRTTPGPYSVPVAFTRTLRPPQGERALVSGGGLVFSWAPKPGAHSYQVQVAASPDFGRSFDSAEVEAPAYAPTLTRGDYAKGGNIYWRVATVDAGHNVGNVSKTMVLHLPRHGK